MLRNSAKLLSSNVLAQVIALLIYPILTRYYGPSDFGLFQLFMSIGGVMVIFSTGDYHNAIVLPSDDKKGVACFHVGFVCLLLVTVVCVISVFFRELIASVFNEPSLSNFYWMMPLFVFGTSLWILLSYWFMRQKEFAKLANYQIVQSVLNSVAKCGLGFGGIAGGLVYSTVFAPLLAIVLIIRRSFKSLISPLFKFDRRECIAASAEYSNFPRYSLPNALVNYLNSNLPILMLTPFFGASEIGFWGMALTLAFRPINMISGSLYQVFYQQTSERVNECLSILPFFKAFVKNTLLLVIPVFVIIYIIAPYLVEFLLGADWLPTALFVQYMLPWLVVSLICATICYVANVFGQQRVNMWIDVVQAIVTLVVLFVGIQMDDFNSAMLWFCASQFLIGVGRLFWYMSLVNKYEKQLKIQ